MGVRLSLCCPGENVVRLTRKDKYCTPEISDEMRVSPAAIPYDARESGRSSNLKLMVSNGSLLLTLKNRDIVSFSQLTSDVAVGCRTRGGREEMRTEKQVGGDGQPVEANAWRHIASSLPVSASEGCCSGARCMNTRS